MTVVLSAICCAAPSLAQTYPVKPVRVVIVFPPGGSNDVVGRLVFQKMSEQMGQQFVIDNRGGAAGTIGSEIVAHSPPDGYTLMVQSATHVANAHLYKTLPYDVLKDFFGITTLARQVDTPVLGHLLADTCGLTAVTAVLLLPRLLASRDAERADDRRRRPPAHSAAAAPERG